MRDPRTEPQEGDILKEKNGTRELHVDMIKRGQVYYRCTDGHGGLLAAYRTPINNWRALAPVYCDG